MRLPPGSRDPSPSEPSLSSPHPLSRLHIPGASGTTGTARRRKPRLRRAEELTDEMPRRIGERAGEGGSQLSGRHSLLSPPPTRKSESAQSRSAAPATTREGAPISSGGSRTTETSEAEE